MTREEKIEVAKLLREDGATYHDIGVELGYGAIKYPATAGYRYANYEKVAAQNIARNEEKRRWDRDHAPRARCVDCGAIRGQRSGTGQKKNTADLYCIPCWHRRQHAVRDARDSIIVSGWLNGLRGGEIAKILETSSPAIAVRVCQLRGDGVPLPYRYNGGHPDAVHQEEGRVAV